METKHFGQFSQTIQPARDFTKAVNKIETATVKDKILDGLLAVCGFSFGKRVAHNMTHPSGRTSAATAGTQVPSWTF